MLILSEVVIDLLRFDNSKSAGSCSPSIMSISSNGWWVSSEEFRVIARHASQHWSSFCEREVTVFLNNLAIPFLIFIVIFWRHDHQLNTPSAR